MDYLTLMSGCRKRGACAPVKKDFPSPLENGTSDEALCR
jgi:hypothetical protein